MQYLYFALKIKKFNVFFKWKCTVWVVGIHPFVLSNLWPRTGKQHRRYIRRKEVLYNIENLKAYSEYTFLVLSMDSCKWYPPTFKRVWVIFFWFEIQMIWKGAFYGAFLDCIVFYNVVKCHVREPYQTYWATPEIQKIFYIRYWLRDRTPNYGIEVRLLITWATFTF